MIVLKHLDLYQCLIIEFGINYEGIWKSQLRRTKLRTGSILNEKIGIIYNTNLMQADIPILVTKTKTNADNLFRNPSPTLFQQLKTKRTPTVPKLRNNALPDRHQTLDPEQRASRSRRISSSAASRRFPKDFFKEESNLNPIRSHKAERKQNVPCMLDTFSHKNFIIAQGEYLMPETQEKLQDTPKFKEKKMPTQSEASQRLAQKLISMKMQDCYVPSKNKYNTCPQNQKAPLRLVNPSQTNGGGLQIEGFPIVSNFNITLGIKDTLTSLLEKGQKFKKRKEPRQKENTGLITKTIEVTKRQNGSKLEGFRIRRKFLA